MEQLFSEKLNEERRKASAQQRITQEKQREDLSKKNGYEFYSNSIQSLIIGVRQAEKANISNKGKGVVSVYIQPFPTNNGFMKIEVEGIEKYEYGMVMEPKTRKVIVKQEGYKTVELTIKLEEGGFYQAVEMVKE